MTKAQLENENKKLRERIDRLETACRNFNIINCELSDSYLEMKKELEQAQEKIKKLEQISVDVEVK